jgi:hypothetical protein
VQENVIAGDEAIIGAPPRGRRTLRQRLNPVGQGLREVVLITCLYIAYTSSRLLASDNKAPAVHRAKELLEIEQAVRLNWEHAVNSFFVRHDTIGLLASFWYATAHYIVTLGVLVWLYFKGRHAYLPARRALMVATILALTLYLMLPTAPPRFLASYSDVLALHADQGWWGADASAPKGMGHLTNELAAFPSLHAGWSLWCAMVLQRHARWRVVKVLGWVGAFVTAAVVVGTANHWVLDVLVGWMVTIAGVVAVWELTPKLPE